MRQVTLKELEQMAVEAREAITLKAQSVGRTPKVYIHWSAGKYSSFFEDYHVNIDHDGCVYVSVDNLAQMLSHTWRRNTGAIGVSMACCYGATTENWGDYPPTGEQVEALAQVIAVLGRALGLNITADNFMTHAEAADLDDYGPNTTCERWDLWLLPGVEKGEGGNLVRGKAQWYLENGVY